MSGLTTIIIILLALLLGFAGGYLFHRFQRERLLKGQQDKAESILRVANEQARLIESQARESALKIVQAAETELKERRIELNKETERLDKRRSEVDGRADKLEQREQSLNKRQSQVDKKANEIEKIYDDQMAKLQEVAAMTTEDARKELFSAVDKEARADMARIYRQIEAGCKIYRSVINDAEWRRFAVSSAIACDLMNLENVVIRNVQNNGSFRPRDASSNKRVALDVVDEAHAVEVVRDDAAAVEPERIRGAGELLVGDALTHCGAERLRAAARHRVEARLLERRQHVAPRHLLDARDVRDFHRGEGLDVHMRKVGLQRPEHLGVVRESSLHVEPTDDVELAGHAVRRVRRFAEHLLE